MAKESFNKNAEVVLSCMEDQYYKDDIVLEHHSLVWIVSGEMKVVQAGSSFVIGPGDTLLFPCHQLATLIKYPSNGQPYKSIVMTLKKEWLKNFYAHNKFNISHQPSEGTIKTYTKHPLLESFFTSLMPYFQLENQLPEKMVSIKIEEAITIMRSIDKDTDKLLANFEEPDKVDLADFMEKNYMFNIKLKQFGYLTARSLSTFKRDFTRIFNTTPQKWLTQKRLELAHYQMAEENKKPNEIYYEVGFEDLSHFSYAFKKHFGYTPTDLLAHKKISR